MLQQQKTMIRLIFLVTTGVSLLVFGAIAPTTEQIPEPSDDIKQLREKRIDYLQQRVGRIQRYIEVDRAADHDLIGSQMDLINAKLDYARDDASRKELLSELLARYDALIEIMKLSATNPPRPGMNDATRNPMLVESELLYLKAEKTRIELMLAEMQ